MLELTYAVSEYKEQFKALAPDSAHKVTHPDIQFIFGFFLGASCRIQGSSLLIGYDDNNAKIKFEGGTIFFEKTSGDKVELQKIETIKLSEAAINDAVGVMEGFKKIEKRLNVLGGMINPRDLQLNANGLEGSNLHFLNRLIYLIEKG